MSKLPFKEVIIVGAGFSGLAIACQLKRKLHFDQYAIYDRAEGIGGAWFANQCKSSRLSKVGSLELTVVKW